MVCLVLLNTVRLFARLFLRIIVSGEHLEVNMQIRDQLGTSLSAFLSAYTRLCKLRQIRGFKALVSYSLTSSQRLKQISEVGGWHPGHERLACRHSYLVGFSSRHQMRNSMRSGLTWPTRCRNRVNSRSKSQDLDAALNGSKCTLINRSKSCLSRAVRPSVYRQENYKRLSGS